MRFWGNVQTDTEERRRASYRPVLGATVQSPSANQTNTWNHRPAHTVTLRCEIISLQARNANLRQEYDFKIDLRQDADMLFIFINLKNISHVPHPPLLLNSGCGAIIVASVSVWIPLCFGENSSSLLTHIVEAKCAICAKCENVRIQGKTKTPLCIQLLQRDESKKKQQIGGCFLTFLISKCKQFNWIFRRRNAISSKNSLKLLFPSLSKWISICGWS